MRIDPTQTAIKQHYNARDLAIERLISLYNDDFDIGDRTLFNSVLARYGLLDDGFSSEEEYIIQEVSRRIR